MKTYFKYSLLIAVAVFGLFIATPSAGAVTIAELIAQIQALRKQLVELQSQQGTTTAWCHDFNTNLRIGDEGSEVLSLHNALVKEGLLSDYYASKDFDGSTGFNENTSSAVTGFQQKYADEILRSYGLKYGTGFVGKSTRAKLNKLYGCGVATPLPAPMPTPMPVPIISFTANNVSDTLNITENTSVTLSWFAINADSCSSSGGTSGWATTSRSVSGSAEPADSSHVSATYTLTCKNSSGLSSSKSIRVNVKEASTTITPAPTITVLSPNGGESWQVGSTQKISWRTSNISSPNDKITIYIAPNDDLSKNISCMRSVSR
ncbi:MAG: Serine-rich adhesin for platelets [Candidatus Azambacteria bacterium GW2011_GWA2_42_62]|nr:MAG: Serine-rich adhesin for platelets [Candidatus Azambacteria bacterium GW2011_GWA2_42_62]